MGKIYKNDVGTVITIDVGEDVSGAAAAEIRYIKPDGNTGSWDAEIDENEISYTTKATGEGESVVYDLDQAGVWILQAYVEITGWKGKGDAVEITVYNKEAPTLTIGTNTWTSIADANEYFSLRTGSDSWEEANAIDKARALVSAYNALTGCQLFDLPAEASSGMIIAQCEMAIFLLKYQTDIDARKGLQAQGVVSAGVVQEAYNPETAGVVAIPPLVKSLLSAYESGSNIEAIELNRNDDENLI